VTEKEFISQYINKHFESNSKIFPDEFTNLTDTEKLEMPHKTLVLGNEFFGAIEILTTEGIPVLQAENIHKAKYIVYANEAVISSSQKMNMKLKPQLRITKSIWIGYCLTLKKN